MHVVEFQDELKKAVSAKANKHSYSDDFEEDDDDDKEDGKNYDDGGDDDGRYRIACLAKSSSKHGSSSWYNLLRTIG